jgi:GTPase Era involved in 16S rRNA processing
LSIPEDEIINVLIVGMTGVGKSTFVNSMVNYFMGVEMEDDFRYFVSRDMFNNESGKSSTTKVHIYGLAKRGKMKQAVRLIDIPGLGDTRGIKMDQKNLSMIHQRIKQTVPFLNLIIYVFKATETTITKESEYVLGQTMGIFGRDVGSNMLFVLTFADSSKPSIIPSL